MKKALIVDDEPLAREAIQRLVDWKKFGIDTVLEADNGLDALSLAAKQKPDVIFCDMRMPVMNGTALLDALEVRGFRSKMIVVSGYEDAVYMRQAIRCGCVDYILKPVQPAELCTAVSRVICGPQRQPENDDPIAQYIDDHYMQDITLAMLSQRFFLSREHISRSFKKRHGIQLWDYLLTRRIDAAKRMLRDTNDSTDAIAYAVGFAGGNYFCKVFKKAEGLSPTEYRRQVNNLP